MVDQIKIFISCSTKDILLFRIYDLISTLSNFPEIEEVIFCQDRGEDFVECMDEYLGICNLLILICSPNSLDSRHVKNEWRAAYAMNKPIIPIYIELDYVPPLLRSKIGHNYDIYKHDENVIGIYQRICEVMKFSYRLEIIENYLASLHVNTFRTHLTLSNFYKNSITNLIGVLGATRPQVISKIIENFFNNPKNLEMIDKMEKLRKDLL